MLYFEYMENRAKKFKFPKSVLNQIHECSSGFFLVVVNEKNEFEVFQNMDSPAIQLGMINFLDIFSASMQEQMRSRPMIGGQVKQDENEEEE
jgi:sulfur transfer protein SufE